MEQTDVLLRYRGRAITAAEVVFIRELMAGHPAASRRMLSVLLCRAWNWVQANGVPREMICRGLMLALERGGHLVLPPPRRVVTNPLVKRAKPAAIIIEPRPLSGPLSEVQPVEFHQVRRSGAERLFNSLIEQHHYLGYTQPVGEHLKYMVYAGGGRLPAWPGHRRPGTWGPGIASSAGRFRPASATCTSSPTTAVSSSCRGCR